MLQRKAKKSKVKVNKKVTLTKVAKVNLDNIIHHPIFLE